MEDAGAPEGLFLSLDALIERNTKSQRRTQGGRGGRGSGRGGDRRTQQNGSFQRGRQPARQGGGRGLGPSGGVGKPHPAGGGGGGRIQREGSRQQGGRSGSREGRKPSDPLAYRAFQQCYVEEQTGDVVVLFHQTIIVRISIQGDITLDSGGFHTLTTMQSFNDALAAVGVKVSAPDTGHPSESQWLVSDGRSLYRFSDNMTLSAKGPQSAARGPLVLQAFNNPDAAAASAASNAAAAAVGLLPKNAPGVPLDLGNPRRGSWNRSGSAGGGGGRSSAAGTGFRGGGGSGSAGFRGAHVGALQAAVPIGGGGGFADVSYPEAATGGYDNGGMQYEEEPIDEQALRRQYELQRRQQAAERQRQFEEQYGTQGLRADGYNDDESERRRLRAQGRSDRF